MFRGYTVLALLITLTTITPKAFSQEKYTTKTSKNNDDARYEIIQSELAAKVTIKLDKQTGNSWVLTKFTGDDSEFNAWDKLKRDAVTPTPNNSKRVNYQVFTSGLSIRYTFLININSGETWQLVSGTGDKLSWEIIPNY